MVRVGKPDMTDEWKRNYEIGLKYQDFVKHEMYKYGVPIVFNDSCEYQYNEGENILGIEIKNDTIFSKTRNLYIEVAEKTKASNENYVASGIYRYDNSWLYLIGDYTTIFIFGVTHLRLMEKTKMYQEKKIDTSIGFLLPEGDARKYALKIIEN